MKKNRIMYSQIKTRNPKPDLQVYCGLKYFRKGGRDE